MLKVIETVATVAVIAELTVGKTLTVAASNHAKTHQKLFPLHLISFACNYSKSPQQKD